MDDLILKLYTIGAVRFGNFTLKSGIQSPIYIDLRLLVSYPDLLQMCAKEMWKKLEKEPIDTLCGVPYTALPIATAISLEHNLPMLMRRKEVKDYGTKKAIEGVIEPGKVCAVIEDLVTSGASVFETVEPLEHEGLTVKDIVVLLDREQGAKARIEERGYHLHSVITLSDVLAVLEEHEKISEEQANNVREFIHANVF